MPSSSTFTGIGLSLQSVAAINVNTVLRVRFTNDPKRSNSVDANDALNPANYTILGPGFIGIQYITPTSGDPQSVDITLTSRIPAGTWNLSVANIQTSTLTSLSAPTSMNFEVLEIINASMINPGSSNDSSEEIIRKHLNPALKGPGWDALIAGLAAGDQQNFDNAKSAFDQLYISSASGVYLDRITANDGIVRPKNVGISDDNYRKLAIKTKNHKVTYDSILEVLGAYYGEDSVRAHATTEGVEPYALNDGDDLNVTIDGLYIVKIVFKQNEFALIAAAKATEVAAAITRAFMVAKVSAFAKPYTDPIDGLVKVRIYTGTLGLKGSVQIKGSGGGIAQNALQFNDSLNVYTGPITSSAEFPSIILGTPYTWTAWSQVIPMLASKTNTGRGAQFNDGTIVIGPGFSYQKLDKSNVEWDVYSPDGKTRNAVGLPANAATRSSTNVDLVHLGDNRVLSVYNTSTVYKSATLSTGLVWTSRPDPGYSFLGSAGLTLANGNAFYVGVDSGTRAMIFDMNTNLWSEVTAPNSSRSNCRACLLDSGKVFVCGGNSNNNAEVYDPNLDSWTNVTGAFGENKTGHAIVKLSNGWVLITGGTDGTGTDKVYLYNPTNNTITLRTNPMLRKLHSHAMLELRNNYVLVTGGYSDDFINDYKKVYLYNPNTDAWSDTGLDLSVQRFGHTMFQCDNDDKILVAGGENSQFTSALSNQTVETLNLGLSSNYYTPPATFGPWNVPSTIQSARCAMSGIQLSDTSFMVIGGIDFPEDQGMSTFYNHVDLISNDGTTTTPGANLPWNAGYVQTVLFNSGTLVFACGGLTAANTGTDAAAYYNPGTDSWTTAAVMPIALHDHRIALVPATGPLGSPNPNAGKIMLWGGRKDDGNAWPFYCFYDPGLDSWSTPVALPVGVYAGCINVTDNGTISYYSGWTDGGGLQQGYTYTDTTGTFAALGFVGTFQASFRSEMAKLSDGKIVMAGGSATNNIGGGANPAIYIFYDNGEGLLGMCTPLSGSGYKDHKIIPLPYAESQHAGIVNIFLDCVDSILFDIPVTNPIVKDALAGVPGATRGFCVFTTTLGKILIVGGYNEIELSNYNEVRKSTN